MLHTENNQQDCGAPPPLGEDWSVINEKVTGTTTNVLGKPAKPPQPSGGAGTIVILVKSRWDFFPAEKAPPGKHQNNM